LYWTPTRQQAVSTNPITLWATDNGFPPLSNSISFTIYVNDYVEVTLGSAPLAAGESTNVPIDFFSTAALSNLQCMIELPGGQITNGTVTALIPETASLVVEQPDPETLLLTFTNTPGHTLQGTQHLARLNFTAVPDQVSAFVPLPVSSVAGTRVGDGPAPSALANAGRAVIVGEQPLLESLPLNNGNRQVMFYGKRNTNYRIQVATNLDSAAVWTVRTTVSISTTNQYRVVPLGRLPAPPVFFRAVSP